LPSVAFNANDGVALVDPSAAIVVAPECSLVAEPLTDEHAAVAVSSAAQTRVGSNRRGRIAGAPRTLEMRLGA
jgi:hypothetical protein